MKKRLPALPALLVTSFILASTAPVFADPGQDQGLPSGGAQQLQPMQPIMATPANYYPAQAGGPPQGYPQQSAPMQSGYPQQYGGQAYPSGGAYPPQGYPQQGGAPYQAGVSEAVPGQGSQAQPPQQQYQQAPPQQQYQQPPQQGYQQPSPYEMQEQAIQKGHMQNRSELDKYSPPPEVPDAVPDPGYRGKVSKRSRHEGSCRQGCRHPQENDSSSSSICCVISGHDRSVQNGKSQQWL